MSMPLPSSLENLETTDTRSLVKALEASPRFRRDTPLGGILHRGKISFREVLVVDSLHIVVEGNRVSAHVDHISPLNCNPRGTRQYSWLAVLAHNVADMTADITRRLRGRGGEQRCTLDCEVVWVEAPTPDEGRSSTTGGGTLG